MMHSTNKDINILEKENLPVPDNGKTADKRFYIESYGCQMNFSDSEIVASILQEHGYNPTAEYKHADIVLINTCSIRENAEERVKMRLNELKSIKKNNPEAVIGILGCMAERIKHALLEQEQSLDMIVGPDGYRDLPALIHKVDAGQKAVNVLLSTEETYADINPVRLGSNGVTAFISIMRGCDNMCSFCVVPFTRGRERSRDPRSILQEAENLLDKGYKEITLLGQNVDSYNWEGDKQMNFACLLEMAARISPDLRIRFSTSHPKDMSDEVLHVMAKYDNICKYIHLPVQSGNSRILKLMNRTYDSEWYRSRVETVRKIIPDCGISTDIIAGFCSETEEEHQDTLRMMELVKYDMAYMFKYSERPGTLAARKYKDDVPEAIKSRRLDEIIKLQQTHALARNKQDIGKVHRVLVEKISKRSKDKLYGRNDQNKVVIFPKEDYRPGDYVNVLVTGCTSATLKGKAVN